MGFGLKTTTGIIAAVLVTAALAQASKVFAPLAAALFIIAIVWPIQKQLQSWMPKLAALAITVVATVAICLGFASLAAWGFGRVGRSLVGELPRYQALYSAMVTWVDGLPFAFEWGVIAFVLNYIPFIGPFVATLFPTLLAMTQFESWPAVLGVFVCLNVIQFAVGSYIEPRVAGWMLSISPVVVLFAIFFWTFLWGLFGTFIGVPIA